MKRFEWPCNGKTLPENRIVGTSYRISVLNDGLLRLEYDPEGLFEDRSTRQILNRDFPAASFTADKKDGILTVETALLSLTYTEEKPFDAATLTVALKVRPFTVWHFGEPLSNLMGTARTLDGMNGRFPLNPGILSRDGIATVDDSDSVALDDGWIAARREETDLYLFAFGHDYKAALRAFYRLTGDIPFLPAYAFGNWWSRYHAYTQEEYVTLMERFKRERVPLSVAVIDMDWHLVADTPDEANWGGPLYDKGWTGYTWNEKLFPDYKGFLPYLHDNSLKTTLNLHPASGMRFHEKQYETMARALGVDPATKKPLKLDLFNQNYMEKYFDLIHHPYEEEGVDFWWMDWQQGTDYWWIHDEEHPANPLEPAVDPLWFLNHLHILDIGRSGKRPMFFSRYAGIGSHRYPVGFSGDMMVMWEALDFEPEFTATASNVGYCWWSHDIGGHMGGYKDDELETRWVQFGCFSPILRLHSTSNPFCGKEPWNYRGEFRDAQEKFLRLRQRLFPYIYTMNHRAHTESEPLVQPLYYIYPEKYEAYERPNQYFFGTEFMVAPITQKADTASQMGKVSAWLPEGDWYDAFLGLRYKGGRFVDLYRYVTEYPVLAKPGAIVPMQDNDTDNGALGSCPEMTAFIFPGADGAFTLYEDAGDGSDWKNGAFATTRLAMTWKGDSAEIAIAPAEGDKTLIPAVRRWTLQLRGFGKDAKVEAASIAPASSSYDEETNTLTLVFEGVRADEGLKLTLTGHLTADNASAPARANMIMTMTQGGNDWKIFAWKNFDISRKKCGVCEIDTHEAQNAVWEMRSLDGCPYRF